MRWMNPPQPPAPATQAAKKEAADKEGARSRPTPRATPEKKDGGTRKPPHRARLSPRETEMKKPARTWRLELKQPAEAPPVEAPAAAIGHAGLGRSQRVPTGCWSPGTASARLIQRIETNSPRLTDQENRSGYLGHLNAETDPQGGCLVRVVGDGTPAQLAGLRRPSSTSTASVSSTT